MVKKNGLNIGIKNNFKLFDFATRKGNNIFIHGRIDDVINTGGIELAQVK